LFGRAGAAPHDPANFLKVKVLGEHRGGRHHEERKESVHVFGCVHDEFAISAKDVRSLLKRPERGSEVHHADGMQAEFEGGHYAEVSAAAADRPEQVAILARVGGYKPAVREHHVNREQVVDGEAVLAGEVADASAQGETTHAGGGYETAGRGHAEGMGGMVDVAP